MTKRMNDEVRSIRAANSSGISASAPRLTGDDITAALDGKGRSLRLVTASIEPIIRQTVRRGLRRHGQVYWRSTPADVDDLVQDMYLYLLEKDAKVLRVWDPSRGTAFLRLVIDRRLITILRSSRLNPARLMPVEDDVLSFLHGTTRDGESRLVAIRALTILFDALQRRLTAHGWRMFSAIFIDEWSTDEIAREFKKKPNAVHQWRRRLRVVCKEVIDEHGGAAVIGLADAA